MVSYGNIDCMVCARLFKTKSISRASIWPKLGEAWMKVGWNEWLRMKCRACDGGGCPERDRDFCRRCHELLVIDKFKPRMTEDVEIWCTACWKT